MIFYAFTTKRFSKQQHRQCLCVSPKALSGRCENREFSVVDLAAERCNSRIVRVKNSAQRRCQESFALPP